MIVIAKLMGAVLAVIGVAFLLCALSQSKNEDCHCDRCRQVRDSDKS